MLPEQNLEDFVVILFGDLMPSDLNFKSRFALLDGGILTLLMILCLLNKHTEVVNVRRPVNQDTKKTC